MLDFVFLSFNLVCQDEKILVISHEGQRGQKAIEESAERCGLLSRIELVNLEARTRGQAETVYQGLQMSSPRDSEPITIFNVDTLRPGYRPTEVQATSHGWLECVVAAGESWSFVVPDANSPGKVAKVTEKERVSNLCSTGMYFFRSRSIFESAYNQQLEVNPYPELFVAPMYNFLLREGLEVAYETIDARSVFFCGTPADYMNCQARTEEIETEFDKATRSARHQ